MEDRIIIYKTKWDDDTKIKRFLNLHLLKYRVEVLSEELFARIGKETPIIKIGNEYFVNPGVEIIKAALGIFKESTISYHDLLIVGNSVESLFVLDNALKNGLDAIHINKNSSLKKFHNTYDFILKVPSFLDKNVMDLCVEEIEIHHNRLYIKVIASGKVFYTRSLFIMLDKEKFTSDFYLNLDEKFKSQIFFNHDDLIKRIKEKRVQNKRKRVFAITGNNEKILTEAMSLYDEITGIDEFINFKLFILSELNFRYADKFLLSSLRRTKKVKIIGQTKMKNIKEEGYQLLLETDMLNYNVDLLLIFDKYKAKNDIVKELFDFDGDGNINTDQHYKTKRVNMYSMIEKELILTAEERVHILDRYIECAEVTKSIMNYLDMH